MSKRSPLTFFALVFGLSIPFWLIGAATDLQLMPGLPLSALMAFCPLAALLGLAGPIDEQKAHDIVNAYSLAFFDRHLRGRPSTLLDGPAKQYPEVMFESRRP